jgi:hypothetical protein
MVLGCNISNRKIKDVAIKKLLQFKLAAQNSPENM